MSTLFIFWNYSNYGTALNLHQNQASSVNESHFLSLFPIFIKFLIYLSAPQIFGEVDPL